MIKEETVTITVYQCDICKKEVETKDQLKRLALPCAYYELENYIHYKTNTVNLWGLDACNDCCHKIINALETVMNFGFYAYDGFNFKLKETEKSEETK